MVAIGHVTPQRFSGRRISKRWLRFAWWASLLLAAGPITGPLIAGVVHHVRKGEPIRAGLYLVALIVAYVLLGAAGTWAARFWAHQLLG